MPGSVTIVLVNPAPPWEAEPSKIPDLVAWALGQRWPLDQQWPRCPALELAPNDEFPQFSTLRVPRVLVRAPNSRVDSSFLGAGMEAPGDHSPHVAWLPSALQPSAHCPLRLPLSLSPAKHPDLGRPSSP
jgi:hypothetical protein